ncbi:MAG: hypothetical protein RLY86_3654 [Pseudomonadota bacterium]|jgi:hypothetical protein
MRTLRHTAGMAVLAAGLIAGAATAQTAGQGSGVHATVIGTLPAPQQSCVVSVQDVSGWRSAYGFGPPDGATFDDATVCNFYKWGAQMFLWLTSRGPTGDYIFISPEFYNGISDGKGGFVLEQNVAGDDNVVESKTVFSLRSVKPLDIENGQAVPLDSVGQAGGGGVLISQAGSLVYYSIHVNDIFASLWLTKDKVPYYNTPPQGQPVGTFPLSAEQVTEISTATGMTFPEPGAMGLELKASWVDAASVDPALLASMLTINASVPQFVKVSDTQWTWDGTATEDKVLALVGMHVVGSVAGHPELVWATFEHLRNTEDATWSYVDQSGGVQTVPFDQNAAGRVFFAAGTAAGAGNVERATATGKNLPAGVALAINAKDGQTIGPVSTVRVNPWGNIQPATPTATDPVVANNTELLSLALSVDAALAVVSPQTAMVQGAYLQIGSIWTQHGTIPNQQPSSDFKGSLTLANSTMETFHQNLHCFTCHSIGQTDPGTDVSHVFPSVSAVTTAKK